MKKLPHPQTIRKWYSNIDFSPGISKLILDNLKNMIDENTAKGLKLQFGLQVDEISIKNSVEWDGKKYHGQVDLGLENEESEEATYALVYMIVSLNGYFKTPIAYYFIRSLTADVRANITNQILTVLHDNGITDIRSMTFDGAATNLGMVKHLGANIQNFEDCFFKHPITKSCIVVVPDSCHMLKLVRNTTSEFDLIDNNGNHIQWRYLEKLVEHQENEHLHLGIKIRRRHIQYQKEKMKVKLAAQIFSNRVSDALLFLKNNFPDKFTGTEATATYCKKINDIFDLLNSRRKFEKYSTQNCITIENLTETENRVNEYIDYIKNLKIVEDKVSNKVTPILMSKRRTGFWGLIIGMKSALKLARYVFEQKLMT